MATTIAESPKPQIADLSVKAEMPRLTSLDVFRGLTIAAMILVNNAGDWAHTYWPLRHAQWNGWTPTDLVFPFFLFIVGVSMVFSFATRMGRGQTRSRLLPHAFKRSAIIFALGIFLYAYPKFDWHTARIPGVLQRIAVVYLITSILVLYTGRTVRAIVTAVLLLGYWALLTWVPVPGYGPGVLTMDGNLVGYLDRHLIYNHLYIAHRFDPEGILSTIPAIATCLLGVFTGEWMRSARSISQKLAALLAASTIGLIAGQIWNVRFPINKMIWTSSFVLFTAGFALFVFAICYWLIDVRGLKAWGTPFLMFGLNPLIIYFFSEWVDSAMHVYHIGDDHIKKFLFDHLFATTFPNPYIASMAWALAFDFVFFLMAWALYRKRIFVRV